ncbi:MAG: hypothetical protein WKF96_15630 [Solirubrobacteraceae bacterium]
MRSSLVSVLAAFLIAPAAASAHLPAASAQLPAASAHLPAASAQLPAGPVTARGVEFVGNFAEHTDTAGARLLDGYFYVTTERDLTIYDVSAPETPKKVGSLSFGPQSALDFYFPEEDPDTNGNILITSNQGAIEVIDVSDRSAPKFLSKLAGDAQHTITCVLHCTWAYGSEGSIIDLRDPKNPKLAGNWNTLYPTDSEHDVTEVKPGIVLTSSQPQQLLDARTDPANPTRLASVANEDKRFNHANLWPNQMKDNMVLVGGESVGPACDEDASAAFQTYDASNWAETGTFNLLDEFRLDTGLLVDGRMVDSTYCVHWFTTHPSYRNGGLVAIAWYEHGTRLLNVSPGGEITEVGWFLPLGSSASAAYWITDRIIYVSDYNRGLDVLRYTGPLATAKRGGKRAP